MTIADCRRIAAAALCACALLTAAPLAHAQDARETAARAVAGELGARQFDKVAARFNETMANALSVERLASTWDQVVSQAGKFKSAGDAKSADVQGQHVLVLTCAFENATLYITVAFDADSKVSGLLITPQRPPI
jgi:Protein of unknown function (DUF3887)